MTSISITSLILNTYIKREFIREKREAGKVSKHTKKVINTRSVLWMDQR